MLPCFFLDQKSFHCFRSHFTLASFSRPENMAEFGAFCQNTRFRKHHRAHHQEAGDRLHFSLRQLGGIHLACFFQPPRLGGGSEGLACCGNDGKGVAPAFATQKHGLSCRILMTKFYLATTKMSHPHETGTLRG